MMESLLVPGRLGFEAPKTGRLSIAVSNRVVGGIVDKDVSVPMGAGSPLDRTRLPDGQRLNRSFSAG